MSSHTEKVDAQIKELEEKRQRAEKEAADCASRLVQIRGGGGGDNLTAEQKAAIKRAEARSVKFNKCVGPMAQMQKCIYYQEALMELKETLGSSWVSLAPGKKWDRLKMMHGGVIIGRKIDRDTGDVYGAGKVPKGNIISDAAHIFINKCMH